ncbi:helix-turn-helix domain-containing protein [Natrarchaeobius chitinivorans]|uniref:Bacterio-opsin activator n=1 Tax=Natrarchaeobius chitinivorans TaxID=1679083 RepID=A0A3N6LRJ8_NATCH|nr:helix-turn-helix domain-containing protein [Natrarchaeobius chitinivorans]RQG92388.1 bacterio-opsin activator [Natrarchaeobius chitinivorans]
MTLIVEFELDTPILRTAAEGTDEIRIEEVYETESGESKLLFCAYGDDFERFESALEEDSTVSTATTLDDAVDRRLYSIVLSDRAASRLTYPIAAEYDVSVLEISITDETVLRVRVPSRETLAAYRQRCLERVSGFRVRRLYPEQKSETGQYGVTEAQYDALLAALEAGYFDVPRKTTLSSVATDLDVSDQALSARLRRGQTNLLEHTLAEDQPS